MCDSGKGQEDERRGGSWQFQLFTVFSKLRLVSIDVFLVLKIKSMTHKFTNYQKSFNDCET